MQDNTDLPMYVVTGVDTRGRRFKAIRTTNRIYAMGINLYRGTVWMEDKDGKRTMLIRVWNP